MINTAHTQADYERLLLGCYALGASVNEAIPAAAFQSEGHRVIFAVIRELRSRGFQLDMEGLARELIKQSKLEAAGGYDKIATLADGAYPSNVAFYEGEVLREFRRRSAWKAATELREALEKNPAPDQAIDEAVKKFSDITFVGLQTERGILFCDLVKVQFPPEHWYVKHMINVGLIVLTGASKIGKSWTALQLVTALDQGGYFLGTLEAMKCAVLYLALEDTPRRIQRRLLKQGITCAFNGSRLITSRMTVSALRGYLKANPQFKVVIIDTLQKMLGINDMNDYAKTVDGLSALKAIADELGIAIIVIHHNRKGGDQDGDHMESALGSTGIVATADATITMRRKRGASEASLSVSGRDMEDASYTLSWDKDICSWTITGQGTLKPTLSEDQQQVIDLLESEARNWTKTEIVEAIGKSKSATGNLLARMKEINLIESPYYGQWRLKRRNTETLSLKGDVSMFLESDSETTTSTASSPSDEEEIW